MSSKLRELVESKLAEEDFRKRVEEKVEEELLKVVESSLRYNYQDLLKTIIQEEILPDLQLEIREAIQSVKEDIKTSIINTIVEGAKKIEFEPDYWKLEELLAKSIKVKK